MKRFIRKISKLLSVVIIFSMLSVNFTNVFADSNSFRAAKIDDFKGEVKILKAGGEKSFSAFKGMNLAQGDTVTTGPKSSAVLFIDDDKEVRIDENTKINMNELSGSMVSDNQKTGIKLWFGKVFANVKKKLNVRSKFEIKTPTTVAGARGTMFFVGQEGGTTDIGVLEGTVGVTSNVPPAAPTEQPSGQATPTGSTPAPGGTTPTPIPSPEPVVVVLSANQQISLGQNTQSQSDVNVEPVTQESLGLFVLQSIQQVVNESPQGTSTGINPELLNNIGQVIEHLQELEAQQEEIDAKQLAQATPTPTPLVLADPVVVTPTPAPTPAPTTAPLTTPAPTQTPNNTGTQTNPPAAESPIPVTAIAAISGTAQVGMELTAGQMTPAGATVSYQWKICNTIDGVFTNITGAISNKYTPVNGDVNKYLKVAATGTGSYSGTVTSAATSTVTASPPTSPPLVTTFNFNSSTGTITSYTGTEVNVVIPDKIDGVNVVAIGDNAFNSRQIRSVVIPEGVISIGSNAFWNCGLLESVSISKSVTSINYSSFAYCNNLTAINVAANNSDYSSASGVLFNKLKTDLIQFPSGKSGIYTIPASVANIEFYAFKAAKQLTDILVDGANASFSDYNGVVYNHDKTTLKICPEGKIGPYEIPGPITSSIDQYAFLYSGLTSVTIPSSVTTIGDNAFSGAQNLESIDVNAGNTVYCSENGVLFNIGKETLISYPVGKSDTSYNIPNTVTTISKWAFLYSKLKSMEIPNNVVTIGQEAFSQSHLEDLIIPGCDIEIGANSFSYCSHLKSVMFLEGVKTIGTSAFYYCNNLSEITIPSSIIGINDNAFKNCSNLKRVSFLGNAPTMNSTVFDNHSAESFNIYFQFATATGFSTPTWLGYSTLSQVIPNSPARQNIEVVNNGGADDYVNVEGTSGVDSVNIYSYDQILLETKPVTGNDVGFYQLNFDSVSTKIYVSFAKGGIESQKVFKAVDSETNASSGPITETINVYNNAGIPDLVEVLNVNYGDIIKAYDASSDGSLLGYAVLPINPHITSGTEAISINQLGEGAGTVYVSIVRKGKNESSRVAVNYAAETPPPFTFNSSTGTITGYTGPGGAVVIPAKIGGVNVVAIGATAFHDCSTITSLVIPEGVTSIGINAFFRCYALTSVSIPASVTIISYNAFTDCSLLTSISVAVNNNSFSSIGGVLFDKAITNLIFFPEGITTPTTYDVPNTVTSITQNAFQNTKINVLNISANVATIGDSVFGGSSSHLTEINVAAGNSNLSSVNGVLFNKDKTTIIAYPVAKVETNGTYSIPSGVTAIGKWAFIYSKFSSLLIPNTVVTIDAEAFWDNNNLSAVIIPGSVATIGSHGFYSCNNLRKVTFTGNAPALSDAVFADCYSGFIIYYISGSTGFTAPIWTSYTLAVASSDATLKASSTVKGQTVAGLGTPNSIIPSVIEGAVTINEAKAADTTNATTFITLFDKTDAGATVKVVKYANGAIDFTGFESAADYANGVIANDDFFIIKVTAQDTTTVNYYKVVVTVIPT